MQIIIISAYDDREYLIELIKLKVTNCIKKQKEETLLHLQ